MASPQDEQGRNRSGCCASSARMVLLQRKNSEGQLWKNDTPGDERTGSVASRYGSEQKDISRMDKRDIEWLTVGEAFLIDRRRSGKSQEERARELGLTRNRYGELERDSADGIFDKIRPLNVLPLSAREECLLRRKRLGWTQEKCAEMMGITRFWFHVMEKGKVPCDTLIEFWEQRT